VPAQRCDMCERDAQPGSALCHGCEDDQFWADKMRAEEAE
jgi:hypothetical protein